MAGPWHRSMSIHHPLELLISMIYQNETWADLAVTSTIDADIEVTGLAVHVGARVAALAGASEVLVTSTLQMLVLGSGIAFADRGSHALKGVPERWQLFAVEHT
jgi:class 3 adenylate cyclase